MVRNYVRKTERQKWSTESMNEAVQSVIDGKFGYKKAADQFQVPQTTLERYVKKKKENPMSVIDKTSGKYQCVFNKEQELELAAYLKDMQKRLFGFTFKELRRLAYQLAERNSCNHPFNKEIEMAGEDWVQGFMARHSDLSLRKPEGTSGARAMGFNKTAVSQFFDLLIKVIDENKLTATRIYNTDESGITVVPKQHSRVIAMKGQRQVGVLTSAERGKTVTVEVCCSAAGSFMPPMLIFPRKRLQKEFELGLPPGGWAECNETGWITGEIFLRWFQKFIEFSNAKKSNPVLLLLDGHSSHTKNLDVIDLARNNGVILLCFPPHCSHRLQPLDVAVMKPISVFYEQEVRKWLRTNPGKVVTLWQISTLYGEAFLQAANMRTAVKGFEATGIWPTNINVFKEDDFLPAATTDISIVEAPTTAPEDPSLNFSPQIPQCSWMPDGPPQATSIATHSSITVSNFPALSPELAMPVPKVKAGLKRVVRNRGKTAILTLSPYKTSLIESRDKSQKAKELKENARKRKLLAKEAKESAAKKKLTSQNKKKSSGKGPKLSKQRPNKHKEALNDSSDESSEEYEDASCLYCNYLYSTSNEGWVSCFKCKKWAHNSCAGIEEDDDESIFICELCQS